MECAPFPEEILEKKVCVVGSELVENYTVSYIRIPLAYRLLAWLAARYPNFRSDHVELVHRIYSVLANAQVVHQFHSFQPFNWINEN